MGSEPAVDLFERWLAHHEGRTLVPDTAERDAADAGLHPEPEPEARVTALDDHAAAASVLAALEDRAPVHAPRHAGEEPAPEPIERSTVTPHDPEPAAHPEEQAAAASVFAALTGAPIDVPTLAPSPEAATMEDRRPSHLADPPTAPVDLLDQPSAEGAAEDVGEEAGEEAGVPPVTTLPRTIFFKPRTGAKRFLGVILLGWLALTAVAAWWAWQDRTYLSYGLAGTAAVVTAIAWAARAGSSPARLTMHGSELEIVRGGSRAVFDLAASHVPVQMEGRPGDRKWKVLIIRRSMTPFVIDASMVDPVEFTKVVRFYRPEL